MSGMVSRTANSLKWVARIPMSTIDTSISDIELNLVEFQIPPTDIGKKSTYFKGQLINLPGTTLQASDKEITLTYLIDGEWNNYYSLYRWCDMLCPQSTIFGDDSKRELPHSGWNTKAFLLPIDIFLLDEFKRPVISFRYHNTWISTFGELRLNYQSDTNAIQHSFTINYTNFDISKTNTLG